MNVNIYNFKRSYVTLFNIIYTISSYSLAYITTFYWKVFLCVQQSRKEIARLITPDYNKENTGLLLDGNLDDYTNLADDSLQINLKEEY